MRRKLCTIILASILLLTLPAASVTASPSKDFLGDQGDRWSEWIDALYVFVLGVWDFYGGYVDPNGNNDGDGDGDDGGDGGGGGG